MVSIPHIGRPADLGASDAVLGLDIGGTKLAAGVVDSSGRVLSLVRTPTPAPSAGWRAATEALFDLGERAIEDAHVAPSRVTAVGIGSGGPLDAAAGIILRPPNLPAWEDVPVTRLAEAAFQRRAFLENDANAAALATYEWGEWAGTQDLVYLTISTGIGGGALVAGRLLRGASGNVAEFGHTVVDWDGRLCDCGQRGCAEAYVSGTSIARRAQEALIAGRPSILSRHSAVTASDVATAAVDGDTLALEIWSDTTAILGALVTSVLNVFEPRVVVLGGGVTEAGAMLIDPIRAYAKTHAMSSAGRAADVVISEHGRAIGVLGSAAVAMARSPIGLASA